MKADPETKVAVSGQVVDGSLAPSDRTFRDAWQLEGEVITVDMDKARNIQRERIRAERVPAFRPYDDIIRILDRKRVIGSLSEAELTSYAEAEAAAQKLRDAPQRPEIDGAGTPEELSALTLSVLAG